MGAILNGVPEAVRFLTSMRVKERAFLTSMRGGGVRIPDLNAREGVRSASRPHLRPALINLSLVGRSGNGRY